MQYLDELYEKITNMENYEEKIHNPTIVMDNCRIHGKDECEKWAKEKGWKCQFLPPYSPFLNPIEECFSILKSAIKNLLASPDYFDRRMQIATMPWGEKNEARVILHVLHEVLERAIPVVTQAKVMSDYNHMLKFVGSCINDEKIQ